VLRIPPCLRDCVRVGKFFSEAVTATNSVSLTVCECFVTK
jgi:hypothetical protein